MPSEKGDGMFAQSWRLGRIAGIEIRVDPSWTLIAILVAYSLFLQFTLVYPSLSDAGGIALAVGATALFFGSVLAHEMTHALVAGLVGIPVRDITLFFFGGATHADVESHGPRDEFVVSIVGPLSSIALAGLFWWASILGRGVLPHPVEGAIRYLGSINLLLAVFNFLPGFPLDGGRVLRSVVWGATGNLRRATRVATLAGEVIGERLGPRTATSRSVKPCVGAVDPPQGLAGCIKPTGEVSGEQDRGRWKESRCAQAGHVRGR
jgi:Zn-dependent protease